MALKHDAQGFLTGDPIDIGRAVSVLGDIRSDVRAIRRAITNPSVKAMQEVARKNTTSATPAQSSTPAGRMGAAKSASNQALSVGVDRHKVTSASPAARDGSGRFVKKSGAESSDPKEQTEGALKGFASRVVGAINGAGDGMSEVDPSVKAMQEVTQPMARGYALLSGGSDEKRKDGLLRRIYSSLTGLRTDQATFNKSAKKSLKGIEDKDEGKGGGSGGLWGMLGGLLGGLMSMLGRIPVIGPLLVGLAGAIKNLLAKVPVIGAPFKKSPTTAGGISGGDVAKTGSKAGTAEGAVAKGAEKGGILKSLGKFGKKIPLIGTLLALGFGASESLDIETDKSTSRDDKNAKEGKNWGGIGGGLGGMAGGAAIGTVIFPGVGTIIGGIVGAVVGDWLGGNAGEIIGKNFSAITNSMTNSWREISAVALGTWDWISSGWDVLVKEAKSVWDSVGVGFDTVLGEISSSWKWVTDKFDGIVKFIGGVFGGISGFLKDKFGIDIQASLDNITGFMADGWKRFTDGGGEMWKGLTDKFGNAVKATEEFFKGMVPKGLVDNITNRRALATGANYGQGNIKGLDDAHTRALVAATTAQESNGGELDSKNEKTGAIGKYQAMPSWLANANLINGGGDAIKKAAEADKIDTSKKGWEAEWGKSGKSMEFLKNDKNWIQGASLDKYLSSSDMQDNAFKINSDKNYAALVKNGSIVEAGENKTSQDKITAILSAANLGGVGGAAEYAHGKVGAKDVNGTSTSQYGNKTLSMVDGLVSKYAGTEASVTPVNVTAQSVPSSPVNASTVAVKSVSASLPPKMPVSPITSASVEIPELQSGREGGRSISVTIPAQDVGQDIRDRRIAHIATGGMSGYS